MNNLTIGQFLKQRRKEKNISWRVASDQTKIHQRLLEHLEKNNFEKLPNLVYLRGFINHLSKVLEFDKTLALDLLENDYGEYLSQVKQYSTSSSSEKSSSHELYDFISVFSYLCNWKHFLWLSSAGLFILGMLFLGSEFSSNNESAAPKRYKIVMPKKLFASSHAPAVKDQALPVSPLPTLQKIMIRATQEESWISYQVDSQPERKLTLLKNKEVLIQGQVIKLKIGRPEAVTISLDGQDVNIKKYVLKSGTALFNFNAKSKNETYVVKND